MLQLLSSLFSLLNKLFAAYQNSKLEAQGRQQVEEVLNVNVVKAEEAVSTPDPVRDERLRSRFDAAQNSK